MLADVRVLKAAALEVVHEEQQRVAAALTAREAELSSAYDDGFAAGREFAEGAGVSAAQRAAVALDRAVSAYAAANDAALAVAADEVVAVALDIARWVLAREVLAADAGGLAARLTAAVDALAAPRDLVVRVSPANEDLVVAWAAGRARVVADPSLAPGDAAVSAAAGAADVSVGAALRRAAAALTGPEVA